MKRKVLIQVIVGLLALSLTVISAFVPWFRWSFQEESQVWTERTSVWGPPAVYSSGPSYASVDVSIDGIKMVNWAAAVYLVLFLLAIVLWIALLRLLGRELERRTVPVVLGIGSVGVSIGLVVFLGLGELIAQRVGLYAATRTSEIVVAEMVGIQVLGPTMLFVGIVVEAVTLIWSSREKETHNEQ
jgi:heme/copper-type cytochrome/quinol oxidase subunit 4